MHNTAAPAEGPKGRPNPARSSALLSALFPRSSIACELRETADSTFLLPEEAGTCGTFRSKRLAEFAAGRLCARRALEPLGFEDFALCQNADRTPRWPEGIVGSITHTAGFCGAVADRRENVAALGLDAEVVASVVPALWSQILTAEELTEVAQLDAVRAERFAALAFSAKEAFYKAQFALTASWLDFGDVSLLPEPATPDCGTFGLRPASAAGRRLLAGLVTEGRYQFDGPHVIAGIALRTSAPARSAVRRHLVAV